MRSIYILLLTLSAFSCKQSKNYTLKKILNNDSLISQFFSVNINIDTTLITKRGCIIKLPKGSLESDSTNVKIDIKELLTVTDIVLAGITTQSNKQSLSSGGMFYINAASGYKIIIKKPLKILVPTNAYNNEMKVFKGEREEGDKINWINPAPLPKDSTNQKIGEGEKFFKSYCANCHKVYADFTGPALFGVTDRRTKKWLYNFTRNGITMFQGNVAVKADSNYGYEGDSYLNCLSKKFGSVMTPFPLLSDIDLDKIYSYIKSESDKRPDLNNLLRTCCDSCDLYNKLINPFYIKNEDLTDPNGNFLTLETSVSLPQVANFPNKTDNYNTVTENTYPYSKVTPLSASGVYYTIDISATGWYNIDILLKELSACRPSELFVRVNGNYKIDFHVVLIIPAIKAFVEGGKLKDDQQYGFDEDNGNIPLPQNVDAYIFAFGEYKNKIIYGKKIFRTQAKQAIELMAKGTTREKMILDIRSLNLDDVKMSTEKSKNADGITKTINKIEQFENLKPRNCNCDLQGDPFQGR